ncbi:MAG: DUF4080 domain-containing protein [Methylococcales bacterium]|nr:DUF4080 domain-containing protein [Methylococcales bacterium]
MPTILLTTLNARYSHASLGLRYLLANMGDLTSTTRLLEYSINSRSIDVAESLLSYDAKIIGFSLYIWNITETIRLLSIIKTVSPETVVVVGGPEISHEVENNKISSLVDYIICGNADVAFANLCQLIIAKNSPQEKIIQAPFVHPKDIQFPYQYYNDEDIANRLIYVEASRGCPYQCEFCLSSLDKTSWSLDIDLFLQELQRLFQRGVRQFKFVDRTFNLKIKTSLRILEFFLDKLDSDLFLHFELVPDKLPDELRQIIQKFPSGTLQFEIGIQTFNPEVQALVSRKQDMQKTHENIQWLSDATDVHLHVDLIVGLPGESLQSFAEGFDQLVKLKPHEIQVGLLKRLKGTPIVRHTIEYEMKYNPEAPYNILSTSLIDFGQMQRLARFARYWDLMGNSGHFKNTIKLISADQPFNSFMMLSDWLYQSTDQTHRIALKRLFKLMFVGLTDGLKLDKNLVFNALKCDFKQSNLKGSSEFIRE